MTITVTFVCDRCGRKEIVGGMIADDWAGCAHPTGWNVYYGFDETPLLCPACAGEAG